MENVIEQVYQINVEHRAQLKKHKPLVIWFTGLSGSGKSTLANTLEQELFENNIHTYSLDGDNIRRGINKNLGFTKEDRSENLRRIAEVANLFTESGLVVLAAFISPLQQDRALVKQIVGPDNFLEVFVDTSLEECERRDVKGLYQKARAGEIKNFTGISAPFEKPKNPDIHIKTEDQSIEEAIKHIKNSVLSKIEL
ncbi:adenylyl-sulfate kinase [Salegentibacter flavus]|uniref:Adenylyl-sulfate kinase n=1 Tax=Salegentibacter flavus TaxID=287099 RepID=A0A1I5BNE6_9FLAO|nr:adenylyl-sulfate kinase [Salegentibacter flavus]SFN76275.1 adenylylsulfate kinase [Salegentibacter flavus]